MLRHLDLAAERQRREVHRNLAGEIVAVALEERMLLDADDDVEIAGRPALRAGFAFAGQPQALPGGDARRDLDRELAQLLDRARRRGTSGTAWLMTRPLPRHCPQVRATVKKPC